MLFIALEPSNHWIPGGIVVTAIYLIRHGKTVDSEEKKYKGHIDVPLSEEGVEQARRLGIYMAGMFGNGTNPAEGLDHIYCSDLSRAVRTAECISDPFGMEIQVMPEIRERSFGRWEGMTFDEIRAEYPDEFNAWAENPLKSSPVGGESTEDVRDRIMPAFNDIIHANRGEHIAIVAHGGVNRIILCEVLGMPLKHIFRIEQDFCALNVIKFYEEVPVLKSLNFMPTL